MRRCFPSSSSFPKINKKPTPIRSRAVKSEIHQRETEGGKKSRFKSPAQARSVRAGSVRAASPASRSDSVATGPSAQCTTFTRAVGAGDHSASSRRAASELVRAQDRSPPVCCRLPVARTRTQIRDSLLEHTPRPHHVFNRHTQGERARVDVFIPAFA